MHGRFRRLAYAIRERSGATDEGLCPGIIIIAYHLYRASHPLLLPIAVYAYSMRNMHNLVVWVVLYPAIFTCLIS